MTTTPRARADVAALLAGYVRTGTKITPNTCKTCVRGAFAVPSNGTPTAAADWAGAAHKHPTRSTKGLPPFVPIWWTGGSKGAGHVAITSDKDGWCYSPGNAAHPDQWVHVPIDSIAKTWTALRFAGWSEDLDGVRVYDPDELDPQTWIATTIYQANVHVGHAIMAGDGTAFHAQITQVDPDLIYLCEMTPNAHREVKRLLGKDYLIAPEWKAGENGASAEAIVLARKSRFKLIGVRGRLLVKHHAGGKHNALWPDRWFRFARFEDTKTGRIFPVYPIHTWWVGKHAPAAVRKAHTAQITAYAEHVRKRAHNRVVTLAGDLNESLGKSRAFANRTFKAAGMKRAGAVLGNTQPTGAKVRLDDLFYVARPFIRPVSQHALDVAGGSDHRGLVTVLDVAPLPSKTK